MAIALITFDRDDSRGGLSNEEFISQLKNDPLISDVQVYNYATAEGRHAYPPFREERHKKLAGVDEAE
jgi:hypothetical protein